jgi:leucyl aminopeptidase
MNVELKAMALAQAATSSCDALVVLVDSHAPSEAGVLGEWLRAALQAKDLKEAGDTVQAYALPGVKAKRLIAVHVGDAGAKSLRKALSKGLAGLDRADVKRVLVHVSASGLDSLAWQHVAMAAQEAFYRYQTTKAATAKPQPARTLVFGAVSTAQANVGVRQAKGIWSGVALAREWANRPANHATPTHLGEAAKALGRAKNLSVKVMGPAEVAKLKMGAFLSVSAGSEQPLRFIVMVYQGAPKSEAPVVLVGKGVTFDTGGISLKPGPGMDEMKFDMGGAASVLGTMKALSELQPRVNVVGLIPACENMPSGKATKPGDVVTSMSGQTIEVLNTDAEGRLILCDALTYAKRFNPRHVIDIATLTGACVIALGHVRSGMFATTDRLAHALQSAGDDVLDPCWRMPLDDEYAEGLKSNFADIPNIAGRDGGSITAAKFLQKFVDYEWAHLDIAGTAWNSGNNKGATGRPVPLLVQHVLAQAAQAEPRKTAKRAKAAAPSPTARRSKAV